MSHNKIFNLVKFYLLKIWNIKNLVNLENELNNKNSKI